MNKATIKIFFLFLILAVPAFSQAAQYDCAISKKLSRSHEYSAKEINEDKYNIQINDDNNDATISRCSLSFSADKTTCDQHMVDKIVFDKNVKIKKFYVLESQYDVQIFSDLSVIENNGRGFISFGNCEIISP